MVEQKFHINKAGDVKECKASVRVCRFGGDVEHFTDHGEAIKAAEQRSKKGASDDFVTVTRKSIESKVSDSIVVDAKLKNQIAKLSAREEMTPSQIQEIGAVFEQELERRLPFNPWDHDLSVDEFEEIKKMNRAIYSALVVNGGDMPVKATGPVSENLNNAIKILPDNVKAKIPELNTTFLSSNTTKRWGQFRYMKEFYSPAVKYETYYFENGMADGAPDNVLVPGFRGTLANLEQENFTTQVYMKRAGEYKLETFWLGKKPEKKGYRKVSNTAEIFVEGKMVTINKPLYAMYSMDKSYKSEIAVTQDIPKDAADMETILLHEYCHAVQHSDKLKVDEQEAEMFDTVASEKTIPASFGARYMGFPDRYMGLARNMELFTVASEGFFLPNKDANRFFYGKTQGPNAKPVRQWITGMWLSLGHQQ